MSDMRKLATLLAALEAAGVKVMRVPLGEDEGIDSIAREAGIKVDPQDFRGIPRQKNVPTLEERIAEMIQQEQNRPRRPFSAEEAVRELAAGGLELVEALDKLWTKLEKVEKNTIGSLGSMSEAHDVAHKWMTNLQNAVDEIRSAQIASSRTAERRLKEVMELDRRVGALEKGFTALIQSVDALRNGMDGTISPQVEDLRRRIAVLEMKPAKALKKAKRVRKAK